MKAIIYISSALALFPIANNSLEGSSPANQQEVIAIQIDKVHSKDREIPVRAEEKVAVPKRVEVGTDISSERATVEKTQARVPVEERSRNCHCEYCQRVVALPARPVYHGRVPVGQHIGRYGQGVVMYPYSRVPQAVMVVRPPMCPPMHPRYP
jgi:hypothetical protein